MSSRSKAVMIQLSLFEDVGIEGRGGGLYEERESAEG